MLVRSTSALMRFTRSAPTRSIGSLVSIERGDHGVAHLRMNRPPVNSLNLELLQDIRLSLDDLHADKSVEGVILGTSQSGVFSAGLDITEMHEPDETRLREFWHTLQEVWIELYGSRLPIVAAITGHAPAGGCLLAMSCDERAMATGKFKMGLNETLLGIVAPPWFIDTMTNTIGHRESERMLGLGLQVDAIEAAAMGLVDRAVALEEVIPVAQAMLERWLKIPAAARATTKARMRAAAIEKLRATRDQDTDDFVRFVFTDQVQDSLAAYIAMLKKPRSK